MEPIKEPELIWWKRALMKTLKMDIQYVYDGTLTFQLLTCSQNVMDVENMDKSW